MGNPNSGKTTLFNVLSGSHEHVGNYSGVTVDAKSGRLKYKGYTIDLTDLPGTYALSAYTPEEVYVRRFLIDHTPDVVVNTVVASNLERNLYLTTQIIDLGIPVVLALNMMDLVEKNGDPINAGMGTCGLCGQIGLWTGWLSPSEAALANGAAALSPTAFRTKLPANDKKNYPLYAKCCELGIPVHIYCSLNLSASVPYDIGHPRYIDEVARDFPELKIMAGVSGWPWVLDFFALPLRHKNVYINFETHEPQKFDQRGSGYESYLYYAEHSLMDRICFATNWTTQSLSLETLISQVEALPLSDKAKEHIFYLNAKRFYEEL